MIDLLNMQRWSGLIAALLLAGCAVGPTYERPAVESPSDWVGKSL